MDNITSHERTLALDVRPRSFGYVVFEGANQIVDFGTRYYIQFSSDVMRSRLAELIQQWQPTTVVLNNRKIYLCAAKLRSRIGLIQQEALAHKLTLRMLDPGSVKQLFRSLECKNKQQAAMYLAGRYPELAWKLPRPRRFFEAEDEYFDYPSHASRQGRWQIYGLALPDAVLDRVYRANALALLRRR